LWHAAHRLRVVAHDFGIRKDKLVANVVYLVATIGTVLTAYFLLSIN
jgi:fumarate reductase subunit D